MPSKHPQSRTPLARMLKVHDALLQDTYPNCTSLSKAIEVSTKTIQRDLDYMRDQLGLPIEYDKQKHGYFYTQRVTHFPTIPTTEGEVLALFVAQKALEQYRGTPFEQPLSSAFVKLSQVLEEEISVNLGELSNAMSFHHTGVAVTDMETFKLVTTALQEGRELKFGYKKLKGVRKERRHVQPYHLGSIDGQWYLFANDIKRDDMRTFVLGRIQDRPLIGKKFKKDKKFSLSERLLGSFGVYSGEGNHKIRIEFDPLASQLVRERSWHPTQSIEEIGEGAIILNLQLDSLEEIERWILGWGSHAVVLGPPALKKSIKAALNDTQSNYQEADPWLAEFHEAAAVNRPDRVLQMILRMERQQDSPGQTVFDMDRGMAPSGN